MNKYIIELLKLQTSVIIPGFGSLMITSNKNGSVVFNALLKFNDGALAKYIAEKEGIDQQNAQNQIAKFVREIEAEIAKGNEFGIFQLGKFQKDKNGDIVFIQDQASLATLKKDGEPTEKKTEPTPTEKKEEIKNTVVEKIAESKVIPTTTEQTKTLSDTLNTSEVDLKKQADPDVKKEEIKTHIEKEIPIKQEKNIFVPADKVDDLEKKSDEIANKKIESVKADISKNIPLATASKKEPLQEKNVFKPAEDKKADPKPAQTTPEKPIETATENTKKVEAETVKTNTTDKGKSDKKEEPKKESVKEKFRKDKPQKIKNQPVGEKKPKKKKRTLMWIIIIIILGGGGYAGWHFRDDINAFLHTGVNHDGNDSTHAETTTAHDSTTTDLHTEVIAEDTLMTETESETEIETETEVETQSTEHETTTQTNHSSSGSYHIIGNCFSSETNADNYVKKMREKGYDATNLGKQSNGLYMVSLRSYATREEAKAGLDAVKADASGAYVYKGR
ncbi:MAG: SPOR domain-containing protein [Crocinitomicaceae bacterium]|nr:SPOR domain-containing protein [Crocinitomicaceae bacterium]